MTAHRVLAAALVAVCLGPVIATGSAAADPVTIPRASCLASDTLQETGLQGQVPWAERLSGRAAMGYHCNFSLLGLAGDVSDDPAESKLNGWANFDTYGTCAYFGDGNDTADGGGGTIVMDVSDPAHPTQTDYLTTGAMQGPWESLRVNARRGLLVADHQGSYGATPDAAGTSPLDVYDVAQDCRHPKLLFSGVMPRGIGHEGWFSPDGTIYWMSSIGTLTPVDLTDPSHPKELASWEVSTHGGSSSDDGTRQYLCATGGEQEGVLIIDSTAIQHHQPQSEPPREIGFAPISDSTACQETYPLTYGSHPYVIQFGELPAGATPTCTDSNPTWSRPHLIDIADEKNPKVVSTWINEVALPENCPLVAGDRTTSKNPNARVVNTLFVYGTHMCHPDRLHDPTILACAEMHSGVRVYDIRDPFHPKEIAYWNVGTLSPTNATVDITPARPVIRPDTSEIWFDPTFSGFHAIRFAGGGFPFPDSLTCAPAYDYFFAQYDLSARCAATPGPAGASAPRVCQRVLVVDLRKVIGAKRLRRLRSARVYAGGKLARRIRGRRALRTPVVLRRLHGKRVVVRVVGRTAGGRRLAGRRAFGLCGAA